MSSPLVLLTVSVLVVIGNAAELNWKYLSQDTMSYKTLMGGAPKPCCFPKQYEARLEFVAHGNFRHRRAFHAGAMQASFDHKNNRTAFRSLPPWDIDMIVNFSSPKPRLYVITKKGKRCRTIRMPPCVKDPKCLPASMKFYETAVLGSPKNNVKFNVFAQGFHHCMMRGMVSVTVTAKGCYPASHSIAMGHLPHHGSMLKVMSFTNISDGIKDPKVFVPPKSCKKAEEIEVNELDELIGTVFEEEI